MTPQSQSNYLSWLREQQVLADKFSKEWSDTYPESRQADYRAGMWFAYRQAEKEFLKEKDDMSEKRDDQVAPCPWCGNTQIEVSYDPCQRHQDCEYVAVCQVCGAQEPYGVEPNYIEGIRQQSHDDCKKLALEKWNCQHLRAELESARACREFLKEHGPNILRGFALDSRNESDLRALLSTINKEEKK